MKITSIVEKEAGLAEIYQSVNLKMALLNPDGKENYIRITTFVKCRDFLTDVFSFSKAKKDFAIYGMAFQGSKYQADTSAVRLLLDFPDQKTLEIFQKQLKYIQGIEEANKLSLSTLTKYKDLQFVLVGDKQWVQNCLHFSLYTLLVRGLCAPIKDVKDWMAELSKVENNTDAALCGSVAKTTWKRIFADLSELETKDFCGFPVAEKDIGRIHHNSGFISVFGLHREISWNAVVANKHWQEMKSREYVLHKNAVAADKKAA